jgi:hypothetical protein
MSAGWDEPSAFGYNHVLDDETMGFTRFCHGSRIVGREVALLFALATADAERLAWVLVRRMRERPDRPERELLSEELWLPSSPAVARAGVVTRALNYLCFANAKVLWRTVNRLPRLRDAHRPVAVAIAPSAPDLLERMGAVIARYHDGVKDVRASRRARARRARADACEPMRAQHVLACARANRCAVGAPSEACEGAGDCARERVSARGPHARAIAMAQTDSRPSLAPSWSPAFPPFLPFRPRLPCDAHPQPRNARAHATQRARHRRSTASRPARPFRTSRRTCASPRAT